MENNTSAQKPGVTQLGDFAKIGLEILTMTPLPETQCKFRELIPALIPR